MVVQVNHWTTFCSLKKTTSDKKTFNTLRRTVQKIFCKNQVLFLTQTSMKKLLPKISDENVSRFLQENTCILTDRWHVVRHSGGIFEQFFFHKGTMSHLTLVPSSPHLPYVSFLHIKKVERTLLKIINQLAWHQQLQFLKNNQFCSQ